MSKSASLEKVRRRLLDMLWTVYRVREATTRTGTRVRMSRPVSLRDASELMLGRREIRDARRGGNRIALRSDGRDLWVGELLGRFTAALTVPVARAKRQVLEQDIWDQLKDVPLTDTERAVLRPGIRRLIGLARKPTLAPCRLGVLRGTCERWLIRKGKTLDCSECRADLTAVERTRIVQGQQHAIAAMRRRAFRQAEGEGLTGPALRDRIEDLMWQWASTSALRSWRLTRGKRMRRRRQARVHRPTYHDATSGGTKAIGPARHR